MKGTARYSHTEDPYDLDHEINRQEEILKEQIKGIDGGSKSNILSSRRKTKVLLTMIETLTEEIRNIN